MPTYIPLRGKINRKPLHPQEASGQSKWMHLFKNSSNNEKDNRRAEASFHSPHPALLRRSGDNRQEKRRWRNGTVRAFLELLSKAGSKQEWAKIYGRGFARGAQGAGSRLLWAQRTIAADIAPKRLEKGIYKCNRKGNYKIKRERQTHKHPNKGGRRLPLLFYLTIANGRF